MVLCMEIRVGGEYPCRSFPNSNATSKSLAKRWVTGTAHAGFADYSRGLMLPIERKSVEPLAAHTDPLHVSAKHQSLHHLVAQSEWSDRAVLACVRDWVMPMLRG